MEPGAFQGIAALVVEDEESTRAMLVRMLARLGFTPILEAADGPAGLARAAGGPQIVLCDLGMEPMDGLAFHAALRAAAEPRLRSLPVVFLTANAESPAAREARKAGPCLAKPITPAALRRCLQEVLASAG